MLKINDRVQVIRPGGFKGSLGRVNEVFELKSGGFIYEIRIDNDFLYDLVEFLLVKDNELTLLN